MWPSGLRSCIHSGQLAAGLLLFVVLALCAQPLRADTEEPDLPPTPSPAFVDTTDLVVTTAEEVITDIQSARFPLRFQRGEIDDFRYVLFPDGSAKVYDAGNSRRALMTIRCRKGVSCLIKTGPILHSEVKATGSPKPDVTAMSAAPDVATFLAKWILANSGIAPVPIKPQSEVVALSPIEIEDLLPIFTAESKPAISTQASEIVAEQIEEPRKLNVSEPAEHANADDETPNEVTRNENNCPEQNPFVLTDCALPPPEIVKKPPPRRRAPEPAPKPRTPAPASHVTLAPPPKSVIEQPQPLSFAEKYKLKCSITSSVTLDYENSAGQRERPGKPRVSLGCSARLTEKLSLSVALIGYAFPRQQESFDPDFTYAFTYRINDTLSLGYSNYSARFGADGSKFFDSLVNGSLRVSARLPKIPLAKNKSIACSVSSGLPNPLDVSVNFSCGYSVTRKFRIGATAYIYFPGAQDEFQPDFSYTASYRFNESWLVTYSNYSNNRWPWNHSKSSSSGFGAGSLSVTYTLKF